eukprot:g14906.t1
MPDNQKLSLAAKDCIKSFAGAGDWFLGILPKLRIQDETPAHFSVLEAPGPKLPEGKQSVFEGVPLLQTDQDLQANTLLERFGQRLAADFQPLDLVSAVLIFVGLSLGFLDTKKRWLGHWTTLGDQRGILKRLATC